MTTAIFILTIIFMTVVVPFVVIMHYSTKWKATKGLSDDEHRMLEDLWKESQAMQSRVNALETILDSEVPDWRKQAVNEPLREPGLINKLYRNPRRGMIFGVCAGLAEYFGFDVTVTRVIVAVAAFFAFPVICIVYVCLGLLLPVARVRRGRMPIGRAIRSSAKCARARTIRWRTCAIGSAISTCACSGSRST